MSKRLIEIILLLSIPALSFAGSDTSIANEIKSHTITIIGETTNTLNLSPYSKD